MRIRSAAGLACVAAMLAGAAGYQADDFDAASKPMPRNPDSQESWGEMLAFGAGVERLGKPEIPAQKEGDTLEVIHKGRVPTTARVFFGTFAGQECLAWTGSVERMVKQENGLPPVPKQVKVVFVKLVRPTKAQRLALRSPAVSGVVEGNA